MMLDISQWPSLQKLIEEVDEELASTKWPKGTHGTAYLYNRGCKGPICRKANRLRKNPNAKVLLEDDYLDLREQEYLEVKRAKKVAEYIETRPPGTTHIDWVERAMKIGLGEKAL